jgi:hypothetical protein
MLVALAITLIMMGAVVTLFGVISESVSGSRAAIEMSDRLRAARNQLQLDLQGATATMNPPLRPENDEGYLEIIEGPLSDSSFTTPNQSLFGDIDDVLMFTMRSRGAPFTGKFNDAGNVRMIESPVAEVIYFLAQDINAPPPIIDATSAPAPTRLYTLYRRLLLVAPAAVPALNANFFDENDLSVHFDSVTPKLVSNTLGDLTKRENRFAHYGTPPTYGDFPFLVDRTMIPTMPPAAMLTPFTAAVPGGLNSNAHLAPFTGVRIGDDVLLNNVLSFDVQVFDPGAPVFPDDPTTPSTALEPSDPGWQSKASDWMGAGYPLLGSGNTNAPVGLGAYVDLGYGVGVPLVPPPSWPLPLALVPNPKSKLPAPPYIYDTWSLHYENDGVDQDGALGPDAGTNGLDDPPSNGIVDDIDEFDTLPPYSVPLRGLRVKIRVYEPSSQVVREAIVVQSFLPE